MYDIFYLKRKRKNIYRYCTIYINVTKFNFRKEVNIIQWASCIRGIVKSFIVFMTRISLFITILSYILFGYKITAEKVYVITAYYNSLSLIMTAYFPQGMRISNVCDNYICEWHRSTILMLVMLLFYFFLFTFSSVSFVICPSFLIVQHSTMNSYSLHL